MVDFPPLTPSNKWFSHFFHYFATGIPEEEAIIKANLEIESAREFGRFFLKTPNGITEMLTVAIEGGGRQLRSFHKLDNLQLSEHGDWRRVHLHTIETCLGKQPFYRHLDTRLKEIYTNKGITTLKVFNTAIFKFLFSFLNGEIKQKDLVSFSEKKEALERGKEIQEFMEPDLSLLYTVSSFGKEAILGILASDVRQPN